MNLTREQTIKAVEICNGTDGCIDCPLFNTTLCAGTCAKIRNENVLRYLKENEPAPSANDTSSNENISHPNDSIKAMESQALEAARKKLLAIYETLTPEECRAWELGEVYADVCRGCGE